ncbi:MAG TPA: DUF4124 domain-containing protein, partial [Geobacteraceae bacterium]|nr:DUF4124 domain-containing protein [Geobacteraceae bacterium]
MKFVLILTSLLLAASIACAETYKWEDADGVHFTDNANSIPEQYRATVIEEARQRSGYYDRQGGANEGLEERSIVDEVLSGTSDRMHKQHPLAQPSRIDSTKISPRIYQLISSLAGGMAVFILIGLLAFVPLWLYALIDIIRSEFADPSNKILWTILLIFLSP